MGAGFFIEVIADDLKSVDDALMHLSSTGLGEVALRTVNSVAARTYDSTLEAMIAGINLSDEYVRSKSSVLLASNPNDATAMIMATNDAAQPSTLTSYGATVVTRAVKNPKRSKGNASIGVARGYRA